MLRGFVKILSYLFLLVIIGGVIFVGVFAIFSLRDLPSVDEIERHKTSLTTRIYSRDGHLLSDYSVENRIFVPIEDIPKVVQDAFISAEDSNFYKHGGVDFIGIVKASYRNIIFTLFKKGQLVGASTITQQVVKNLFLTSERTFSRKIKEFVLARELSKRLSKEKILEIYLNYVYFGAGSYGVYAASKEYFDKQLSELTIDEAALLAAIPKAPSEINPRKNPTRALQRRNWVLLQMFNDGKLLESELNKFKDAKLEIAPKKNSRMQSLDGTNAFSDYIKKNISIAYGSNAFFSKGLFVQTKMDYEIQKAFYTAIRDGILKYDKKMGYRGTAGNIDIKVEACSSLTNFIEKAEIKDVVLKYGAVIRQNSNALTILDENCLEREINAQSMLWTKKSPSDFNLGDVIIYENREEVMLSQLPKANAGLIAMDAEDGSVLAMVGDFYDRPNAFNRAIAAKRQLGSAIKPFVYLTGLLNGFSPNSILVDEELKFSDEWQPRNDTRSFLGSITLRTALERSRNVPTVRLAEMLGVRKTINIFEGAGLNTDPVQRDLTTALGSFNTTVERVAQAFSIFVNKGRKLYPSYIEKIQDSDGKTLFIKDAPCKDECAREDVVPLEGKTSFGRQIISEETAFQILSMLEGAVLRGTGRPMLSISRFGIGGKTGTSSNFKDAWFAVVTNKIIVVLYIGNDDFTSLGENQYGSALSLPIVKNGFEKIKDRLKITPFIAPSSLDPVIIDYKTGQLPNYRTNLQIVEYFRKNEQRPLKDNIGTHTKNQDFDILNDIY